MNKVICARSKNVKLPVEWTKNGQPLNNKGGNILVSYIAVLVRQNVSITFSSWTDVRLNSLKERIWADIRATFDVDEEHKHYILKSAGKLSDNSEPMLANKVSDENHKRASKPLYPYRASRMEDRGVEERNFATSLEPKLATLHEPKLATSLEPKLDTSLEPKLATSLEPKLATSLEPKLATSLEPKLATSLEPKLATSLESKLATSLESKLAT
ncbi:hypothetical protein Lal_00032066 [Lupinus albus]|nr:hypothetical protein Lal_00032066 [Lupinus albus]